jgi:NADH:ubiquinone oxidoreductase subunit 2 (chain N)
MNLSIYVPIVVPSIVVLIASIAVLPMRSFKGVVATGITALVVSILSEAYGLLAKLSGISLFSNQVLLDNTYYLYSIITDITGLLVLLGSYNLVSAWATRNSLVSLVLLSVLGIHYLSASETIPMFLASWGISSAAMYAVAMLSKDRLSVVSGIKYLVMGVVSSSIMVLALAFYVSFTGSLSFVNVEVTPGVIFSVVLLSIAFIV